MALRGRRHIYETAFDSKVDKKNEENVDLIDRIANHPILQLLHIRRRSRQNINSNSDSPNNNGQTQSKSTFYTAVPSTSTDPRQQVGVYTPKSGRHSRFPARSVSTNQLTQHRFRPIGLSKSDDEILNRASDSPEDEDYLEDYREGSQTQDLANDLHSLHVTTQNTLAKVLPLKDNACISKNVNSKNIVNVNPSPLVHYSSAHYRSSDRCRIPLHHSATRPFASSLSKFGSKVQPEKYLQGQRANLYQELSKSQLLPLKSGLQPLKLHSPPGTAPLPVKFSKKTPIADKSPSSWFSPVRQKDLKLPIKKTFLSESEITNRNFHSNSSLNDSMVVLLDTGSQRDLKGCLLPPSVSVKYSKYSSVDSMATGSAMSSLESLRSSMSDGCKSTASNESAISSYRSSSVGSDSSLVTRPFLNLCAPHRSIIQSAKFQILSPISDKSQEPSSEAGFSLKGSPQDLKELSSISGRQKTPVQTPRNIQEDFRNVHHILPGPPAEGQPGSDSGISIEYKHHPNAAKRSQHLELPFSDLPFDMPKLRRRLAAAKPSLSSSNSSISSSAPSSDANVRLSLPPNTILSINPTISTLNPVISRLQVSSGVSQASSSNSSDWDTRSSAESSEDQGTPKLQTKAQGRRSLALELGCAAMSIKGQEIDINLPLAKQNWYHGGINRQEAEDILRSQSEGSYIVRSISSSRQEYSLALKSACGFMHFRVHFDCKKGGYTLGRSDKLFPSVPHIISHFSVYRIPIKGAEHMVLLHPVPSETL